jgi:hypothetical protein
MSPRIARRLRRFGGWTKPQMHFQFALRMIDANGSVVISMSFALEMRHATAAD